MGKAVDDYDPYIDEAVQVASAISYDPLTAEGLMGLIDENVWDRRDEFEPSDSVDDAIQFAKAVPISPFTWAPDIVGLMARGHPTLAPLIEEGAIEPMTGDHLRRAVGIDPSNPYGIAGELLDPTAAVLKGVKVASAIAGSTAAGAALQRLWRYADSVGERVGDSVRFKPYEPPVADSGTAAFAETTLKHDPTSGGRALMRDTPTTSGVGGGFTDKTTDMPFFDDMMKDPNYFRTQKGLEYEIVEMTPTEYFQRIGREKTNNSIDPKLVNEYADKMRQGEQFPMGTIELHGGRISQEGQHRALAAEKAFGQDTKMPVMVVKRTEEEMELARKTYNEKEREIIKWLDAQRTPTTSGAK